MNQHAIQSVPPTPLAILRCAQTYIRRTKGFDKPAGYFDEDDCFILTDKYPCCTTIRAPNCNHRHAHSKHGRTLLHVAHEFGFSDFIPELSEIVKAFENNDGAAALDIINTPLMKRRLHDKDLEMKRRKPRTT